MSDMYDVSLCMYVRVCTCKVSQSMCQLSQHINMVKKKENTFRKRVLMAALVTRTHVHILGSCGRWPTILHQSVQLLFPACFYCSMGSALYGAWRKLVEVCIVRRVLSSSSVIFSSYYGILQATHGRISNL